jgi:23S rRNA pseudouridine1911/1915/1917 synthase
MVAMIDPEIVFEDDAILILGKPAGWIVNDASTVGSTPVIQNWLDIKDYKLAGMKAFRSGIVHRLDKETSGVLIVAKNQLAYNNLQGQFKNRQVKKTYTALLHGKLEPAEGEVNAPVGRLPWNRERFGVLPGGREATTNYKVSSFYSKGKDIFTLANFFPRTGRTHQIRIHAKYLGHPIVADSFYAGRKTARNDRSWCTRLFLHAKAIEFTHPKTHKLVKFSAKLPDELEQALKYLVKYQKAA